MVLLSLLCLQNWLERVLKLSSLLASISMSTKVGSDRVEAVREDALAIPALTALRGESSSTSLVW